MAFTSIKIDTEDKRRFDRLRHEFALTTGQDLAQHELFRRILEHALLWKPQLFQHGHKRSEDWRRYQFELAEETDVATELDRVVYGD